MKYCPVCKLDYSDEAEFCAKCKAALLEKTAETEKVPTDYKRLFKVCAYTFIFIAAIALVYYVFFMLTK